ncbi:hypothetical protein C8T65DRAFT_723540 [Cerioporus squamosus]|nr:hypothetical protein C8T65DRAFT_723540 [Cerioporus squamosus]
MSAQAANAPSVRSTRPAPQLKPLKRDEKGLPVPHVNVVVRDTHRSRLADHYHTTLQDDLMYMTYVHEPTPRPPPRNRWSKQLPPPSSPDNVVQLERIQIHSQIKQASVSRTNLLGPIMALRAISGANDQAGGQHTPLRVCRSAGSVPASPSASRSTSRAPRCGTSSASSSSSSPSSPRLPGHPSRGSLQPSDKPHSASGVVSFGLPPTALGLFPQIEVNFDAYPSTFGMHIHFVTSAKGVGAQNRARALLSASKFPSRGHRCPPVSAVIYLLHNLDSGYSFRKSLWRVPVRVPTSPVTLLRATFPCRPIRWR